VSTRSIRLVQADDATAKKEELKADGLLSAASELRKVIADLEEIKKQLQDDDPEEVVL
jgi:hypothetical protein